MYTHIYTSTSIRTCIGKSSLLGSTFKSTYHVSSPHHGRGESISLSNTSHKIGDNGINRMNRNKDGLVEPHQSHINREINDESISTTSLSILCQIHQKLVCDQLLILSHHLVLVIHKKIQLIDFNGSVEREWVMSAVITFTKVLEGCPRYSL